MISFDIYFPNYTSLYLSIISSLILSLNNYAYYIKSFYILLLNYIAYVLISLLIISPNVLIIFPPVYWWGFITSGILFDIFYFSKFVPCSLDIYLRKKICSFNKIMLSHKICEIISTEFLPQRNWCIFFGLLLCYRWIYNCIFYIIW